MPPEPGKKKVKKKARKKSAKKKTGTTSVREKSLAKTVGRLEDLSKRLQKEVDDLQREKNESRLAEIARKQAEVKFLDEVEDQERSKKAQSCLREALENLEDEDPNPYPLDQPRNQNRDQGTKKMSTLRIVLLSIFAVFMMTFMVIAGKSYSCISTGHVGVLDTFGDVDTDITLSEGFNLKAFWKTVTEVRVQSQNESVGATWSDSRSAVTSDTQSVGFQLDIGWFVQADMSPQLVRHINKNQGVWSAQVIEPCMWQAVKNVIPNYTLVEVLNPESRQEASRLIEAELVRLINERLRNKHEDLENSVVITQVNLSNIDYSDAYDAAIEAKQLAEQAILREERELERVEIVSQQLVVQAEAQRDATICQAEGEMAAFRLQAQGQADAIRIRALAEAEAYLRIRQSGVDPMTNRFYDGWDGMFPRVLLGGSDGDQGIGMIFPASIGAEGEMSDEDISILIQSLSREREALEARIVDEAQTQPNEDEDQESTPDQSDQPE